jgi:putative pre-16S rRNA nuclease
VKVLALDYGSARTGVAVSDPTGTVASPLEVVRREEVERIVVGLPVTLRGEHGAQAAETERFVERLRAAIDLPVESFDERFTTRLAAATPSAAPEDAVAAAHLLESYLTWLTARRT